MANNNIAGLYKQQQTDDRFKVGSPSGSVYWTAGQQLPLPRQAQSLFKQFVLVTLPMQVKSYIETAKPPTSIGR